MPSHLLPVTAAGSPVDTTRSAPCRTDSGPAFRIGRPRRRIIPSKWSRRRLPMSCRTRSKRRYARTDLFERRRRLIIPTLWLRHTGPAGNNWPRGARTSVRPVRVGVMDTTDEAARLLLSVGIVRASHDSCNNAERMPGVRSFQLIEYVTVKDCDVPRLTPA